MTSDNRVRETLVTAMRDLMNLLVHLETVLDECGIRVIRAGGGLTFSGFSFQIKEGAPIDWLGFHIDRPNQILYQIQDRILPKDCPLSGIKRTQARQYVRVLLLRESGFFERNEREQMDLLREFVEETVSFLKGMPETDETDSGADPSFIPVLE
jgi:hypothetical protein